MYFFLGKSDPNIDHETQNMIKKVLAIKMNLKTEDVEMKPKDSNYFPF